MLYGLLGMTREPAIDDVRQFINEAERTIQPPGPPVILAIHPAIYFGPGRMRRSYAPR